MIKVIMVMRNGEVNSVCSPSEDDMYTDGVTYGDCVAHVIPYDTDTSDIGSWYWDGTEFKKDKPAYPGPWAYWENNAWSLDRERLDAEIRGQRDMKLFNSDYTQLGDAVLPSGTTVADWQAYRAALRNIPAETSTLTSPDDVVWPTIPG
jgi:hypothetical protein